MAKKQSFDVNQLCESALELSFAMQDIAKAGRIGQLDLGPTQTTQLKRQLMELQRDLAQAVLVLDGASQKA